MSFERRGRMTRDPPAENERAYLRERQFHPSISTLLLFFTYSSKLIRLPILPADGIDMKESTFFHIISTVSQ
jgi:hypothetical protein